MKKNIILSAILIVVLILGIVINNLGNSNIDGEKFKEEYETLNGKDTSYGKEYLTISIDKNNPIHYAEYEEIKYMLTEGTGIIYFGFPECPWCRNAVPVLLDSANDLEIEKIYYYNAHEIRDIKKLDEEGKIVVEKEGTKEYKELIDLMYDELPVYDGLNDETIKRLYFPTVVFVKEGKIIGLHTSTVDSQEDPFKFLNDKQYNELKQIYTEKINETFDIMCDEAC